MFKLFRSEKTPQTKWFAYRGTNRFERLERSPTLDGKSKELFLVVEGGKGYTKGMGYLIMLLNSNGEGVPGGWRKSDFSETLSYDVNTMLGLTRDKYDN